MKKWVVTLSFIPAAVYVILSAAGLGVSGVSGGWIYRLIIIIYLLYACVCAFSAAAKTISRDVKLPCSLGLGLLALAEIYSFAYLYLWHGDAADITVSNISRNCAYLFFLASVLAVFPEIKGKNIVKAFAEGLSVVAIILIFYGEITHSPDMLYYSALMMMVLCVLPSLVCLITQPKNVKAFSGAIIAMCVLDSANRMLILFDSGGHSRDVVLAFYPMAYLMIGYTVMNVDLRRGDILSPVGDTQSRNSP